MRRRGTQLGALLIFVLAMTRAAAIDLQGHRGARGLAPENTLEDLSRKLASVPLECDPGTRWHYGPSVDVQARLVEVLAGQPFAAVMRERVLDPLGMSETRYRLRSGQLGRFSAIYERDPDGTFKRIDAYNGDDQNTSDWTLTPESSSSLPAIL